MSSGCSTPAGSTNGDAAGEGAPVVEAPAAAAAESLRQLSQPRHALHRLEHACALAPTSSGFLRVDRVDLLVRKFSLYV